MNNTQEQVAPVENKSNNNKAKKIAAIVGGTVAAAIGTFFVWRGIKKHNKSKNIDQTADSIVTEKVPVAEATK